MNLAATKPTFPTYPAYKESGVEWLGEIPMGWYNNKLKYIKSNQCDNCPKLNKLY